MFNCPNCGGKSTKWGRSKYSALRYRCNTCGTTFTPGRKNHSRQYYRQFVSWVGGATVKQLTSNHIASITLLRHFYRFLDNPTSFKPLRQEKEVYLKIDGTYFGRWGCALVYKAGNQIIFCDFTVRENYLTYYRNLKQITGLGYTIKGITSDGNTSLESAIKALFPNIPHQHCLVHLQRSCQTFLTKNPETEAGKQLLELVQCLNLIKDKSNGDVWLKWFYRIETRNQDTFNQTTHGTNLTTGKLTWWYTHKYLRRAYRSIKQAIPNMFLYLDYPNLPKDTNGLEGEFSHFKRKVTAHWGLKRQRKVNLVKWYFYLKSRDGIS